MVFSSVTFLFLFLPFVLAAYYLLPRQWRNTVLLLSSLFFYAWGEQIYVLLMLGSIGLNYLFGRQIQQSHSKLNRKRWVTLGVVTNVLLLGCFKYAGFVLQSVKNILVAVGMQGFHVPDIHLPIGISFFTFQAISFVIDVYRGTVVGSCRFVDCALYISLFPQLIAGPIVRYHQIARQIRSRITTSNGFAQGIQRFVTGLAKKILLADSAGYIADSVFNVPVVEVTTSMAWLGLIAYTLQIYFDFSGYSDMAIGLGRFFGFELPENFNYPYISQSIREFWRRWHISLSTWFRDYLYIPLGGSRLGSSRTYFNLWIVFVLCGLWHGAGWNFIAWGVLHGVYLVLERRGLDRLISHLWRPLRHIYVLGLVMFSWIFFRTSTLMETYVYTARLLTIGSPVEIPVAALKIYDPGRWLILGIGIVFCMPVGKWVSKIMKARESEKGSFWNHSIRIIQVIGLLLLYVLCASFAASNTYQPFIYFRF